MPTPQADEAEDVWDLGAHHPELAFAMEIVNRGPKLSATEDILDRSGMEHLISGTFVLRIVPHVGEKAERRTKSFAPEDVQDTVEAIRSGIDRVWENVQSLMKALDEVAKIHPFIAGR